MEHTGTGASYNETVDQFSFACDKNRNFGTFFRDKCFFLFEEKTIHEKPKFRKLVAKNQGSIAKY